jgi:outer membrane protein assembly factor BamB
LQWRDPQGRELWRFYSGAPVNNGACGLTVAADGTVYFAAGFLYALDKTGSTKWTFKSELTYTRTDYFDGSLVVAEDGTIYAQSYYRQLYAITPQGRKKWATNTTPAGPADLMLSSDGGLRTNWAWFVVPSGLATHGWPSPNGDAQNSRSEEAK